MEDFAPSAQIHWNTLIVAAGYKNAQGKIIFKEKKFHYICPE